MDHETPEPLEVWRLTLQYPALKRREVLNLVLMKWLMATKGRYDEATFNPDYPPAAEYPMLSPSFEYTPRPVVSGTSHS